MQRKNQLLHISASVSLAELMVSLDGGLSHTTQRIRPNKHTHICFLCVQKPLLKRSSDAYFPQVDMIL